MDYKERSRELCQLHITYAGVLNQMLDGLSSRGEEGLILWLYQRKSETYSTDIVRHFHLTAGRVANILKHLEEKELIRRMQDAEDLRRVRIFLTPEGMNCAAAYYAEMLQSHQKLLEMLGEEEAGSLFELLSHILRLAEAGELTDI